MLDRLTSVNPWWIKPRRMSTRGFPSVNQPLRLMEIGKIMGACHIHRARHPDRSYALAGKLAEITRLTKTLCA